MSVLEISGLHAEVAGNEILRGVDLRLESGEVHAVMGPNGAGKSTLSAVIMGRPGYTVTAGSVTLDGTDLLSLSTWERAAAGVHLIMQYPTEVPGVSLVDALSEALQHRGRDTAGLSDLMKAEADRIGFEHRFLDRRSMSTFQEARRSETRHCSSQSCNHGLRFSTNSIQGLISTRCETVPEESKSSQMMPITLLECLQLPTTAGC